MGFLSQLKLGFSFSNLYKHAIVLLLNKFMMNKILVENFSNDLVLTPTNPSC